MRHWWKRNTGRNNLKLDIQSGTRRAKKTNNLQSKTGSTTRQIRLRQGSTEGRGKRGNWRHEEDHDTSHKKADNNSRKL